QAVQRELRSDVVCGDVAAAGTRAAPFQQVIREKLDVRPDALRIDAVHGGRRLGRQLKLDRRIRGSPNAETRRSNRGECNELKKFHSRLHLTLRKITSSPPG